MPSLPLEVHVDQLNLPDRDEWSFFNAGGNQEAKAPTGSS